MTGLEEGMEMHLSKKGGSALSDKSGWVEISIEVLGHCTR